MTQVQVQLFEAESISELQMKLNEFLRGIDEEDFIDVKFSTTIETKEHATPTHRCTAIVVFTPKPDVSYS
jgi:hypothetical protein